MRCLKRIRTLYIYVSENNDRLIETRQGFQECSGESCPAYSCVAASRDKVYERCSFLDYGEMRSPVTPEEKEKCAEYVVLHSTTRRPGPDPPPPR